MSHRIISLGASNSEYFGYVEAMERQYRIAVACKEGPPGSYGAKAVDARTLRCDPDLAQLLQRVGGEATLRARLEQADDFEGFMEELSDILEKVIRASPAQDPPPAGFYAQLVAEIDGIGWVHLVSMDSMLTSLRLRTKDGSGEIREDQ